MATPGTYINTKIINMVLKSAKKHKKDACIVFLDVTQAYDNVGHDHLIQKLKSIGLPNLLSNCLIELIQGNSTQIQTGNGKTKSILFKRGVFQGGLLSLLLFNIAVDNVLDELSENTISEEYEYNLHEDLPNQSVAGFADNVTLITNGIDSAMELI